jgi:PAS domain S-box-containing protein
MLTSSLERKVLGGLGLASIIIAGVTLSYHLGTEHLVASNGRVAQSYALLTALGDLSQSMQSVRMSTRGYLLSGSKDVRALNDSARAQAERAIIAMHDSAGDPFRKQRVAIIEKTAREQIRLSQRSIRIRSAGGALATLLTGGLQYGSEADDSLRKPIDRLRSETRRELDRHERLADSSHVVMFVILLLGSVVELAFAVAAAGVVRRDIAERRRATEAVLHSERVLRSFYDSGVTMMGIVELLDDDIVHVSDNSATGEYFGRDPAQMAGMRASEMGAPRPCIDVWISKYRESLQRSAPVQFEFEGKMASGHRWFSAVVCPIQPGSPSGRPRFSYVSLDVTARKQAEEALRRHAEELTVAKETLERQSADLEKAREAADAANEAKSNFLANMSHEIRTPMTAVLGYSDLLAEPRRTDAERGEWVGVIRRNARHLIELINDILDLSKIEANRMTLESVPCDPAQVIGDVIAMMHPRASDKKIRLHLDFETPLPRSVRSDPLRLRQVLVNLIGNAIKFTEAGEVAVSVACDAQRMHIAVRDTGIGMSADQIARLFRPFTQADNSTTRRFGGTGLGLTISQRLIQLMNGALTVQSERGMGSLFRIDLPVVPVQAGECSELSKSAPGDAESAPGELISLRGLILLAEDAPDTQRLMAFLLRRAGAEVTVVSNGCAALDATNGRRFDVILMDMQMPEMDGYHAAAEMRRRGIDVPIIAITAHAMTGDRERCLAAGCSDYLTKPIDQALLMRCVQEHLPSRPITGTVSKALVA